MDELNIIQNDISKLKLENITIQQNINKVILEKCENVIKLKLENDNLNLENMNMKEENLNLKLENAKLTFENNNFKLENKKSSEAMMGFVMMTERIIPLVLLYYGGRVLISLYKLI
jgi:hypothetical protein